MLVTIVWAVWADWDREFKDYQREFYALDEQKAKQQLDTVWTDAQKNAVKDLEDKLAQAKQELAGQAAEARKADDAFAAQDVKYYDHQQRMNFAKAEYESLRYDYEVARQEASEHGDTKHAEAMGQKMEAKLKEFKERAETFKTTEQTWNAAKAEKAKFHAGVAAVEKNIASLNRERENVEKRIVSNDL